MVSVAVSWNNDGSVKRVQAGDALATTAQATMCVRLQFRTIRVSAYSGERGCGHAVYRGDFQVM